MEKIAGVKKIAVLRANAVGDFIFILPALAALKAAYADAEITLLARRWHAEFLEDRPGPVDRVVVIPHLPGLFDFPEGKEADPRKVEEFFQRMKEEKFDLAFQMHGGGKHSNPFVEKLGARVTIGSRDIDAPPLARTIPYYRWQREVLRYLELADLAGAKPVTVTPQIELTDRDLHEAEAFLPTDRRPFIILHPGSRDPRRRWPASSFARTGDALARMGFHILINGVTSERELVAQVIELMQHPAQGMAQGLSLRGLSGLLSKSSLLVANDSGPLHLADALCVTTVSLFWCSNYFTSGPTRCSGHYPLLSWRMNCPVCGKHCVYDSCDHKESFIADISVDEVLSQCKRALESDFSALQKDGSQPNLPSV